MLSAAVLCRTPMDVVLHIYNDEWIKWCRLLVALMALAMYSSIIEECRELARFALGACMCSLLRRVIDC